MPNATSLITRFRRVSFPVLLLSAPFFVGCGDDALVTVYDKTLLQEPAKCLSLYVTPPNDMIETTLKRLYHFDEDCPLHLQVSYKNGIRCNSTFNVQSKAIGGFPSSYLNMELRKGFALQYSYYIDLKEDVTPRDLEKGFEKIKEDLRL